MSGDEATRRIKRHLSEIRVVVISMYSDAEIAKKMQQAGGGELRTQDRFVPRATRRDPGQRANFIAEEVWPRVSRMIEVHQPISRSQDRSGIESIQGFVQSR